MTSKKRVAHKQNAKEGWIFKALQLARQRAGLSAAEIAKRAGMSVSRVNKIQSTTGRQGKPSEKEMLSLAEALGVPVRWLTAEREPEALPHEPDWYREIRRNEEAIARKTARGELTPFDNYLAWKANVDREWQVYLAREKDARLDPKFKEAIESSKVSTETWPDFYRNDLSRPISTLVSAKQLVLIGRVLAVQNPWTSSEMKIFHREESERIKSYTGLKDSEPRKGRAETSRQFNLSSLSPKSEFAALDNPDTLLGTFALLHGPNLFNDLRTAIVKEVKQRQRRGEDHENLSWLLGELYAQRFPQDKPMTLREAVRLHREVKKDQAFARFSTQT